MRHALLAVTLSATIAGAALSAVADASQKPPDIAYMTAYVKAWQANAVFYDVTDCAGRTCTGIYDAAADLNGRSVFVQSRYTLRLTRDGGALAVNDDRWHVITKQQLQDDLDAHRPSRRAG